MPPEQAVNPLFHLVPYILIFLIFYFLIIKPKKDDQAKHKQKINSLKKNDEIITIGGIHGTIVNVKEKTYTIRIDQNVRVEIDKEAVSTINKKT